MSEELYNGLTSALRGAIEGGVDRICIADARWAHLCRDGAWGVYRSMGALPYALGASLAGERALVVCRHFDTDELASVSHSGVNAALVLVCVDDDNRPYCDVHAMCHACHLLTLEPATVYECKTYVKIACNLSEKYDTPVVVHLTQALVDTQERIELVEPKSLRRKEYKRNREKYVTLPTSNRLCAEDMDVRDKRLRADCESFPLHQAEYRDKTLGVICYGTAYANVLSAAPHVSLLRLGTSYPVPLGLIRDFVANVEDVVVMEEGEPWIERELRSLGLTCHGQDVFPLRMHYTPADVKERLLGVEVPKEDTSLPLRTPAFCADCELITLFTALKTAAVTVHTDCHCAMLGADIPMISVDTALSSDPIAVGDGFGAYRPCVSVVWDKHLRLDTLLEPHEGNTIIVYGEVTKLQDTLPRLGIACRTVPAAEVGAHLGQDGVLLVPLKGECPT